MRLLGVILVTVVAGCGDDPPAYVAGQYTVNTTNRDNGCMFGNWTVGGTGQTTVTLSQTEGESQVSATVEGFAGVALELFLGQGGNVLEGTVDGSSMVLVRDGTNSASEGTCTWTGRAEIRATVDGDFIEGRVDFTLQTNGAEDCGYRDDCVTYQDFNGSRPPP